MERFLASSSVAEMREGAIRNDSTRTVSGGNRGFMCRESSAGSWSCTSKAKPRLEKVKSLPDVSLSAGLISVIAFFRSRKGSAETMLSCKTTPAGTKTSHRIASAERDRKANIDIPPPAKTTITERKILPEAISNGANSSVEAISAQANGKGPNRSGPGGRNGILTSSP